MGLRILILCLLISCGLSAQVLQKDNTFGREYNRLANDSLLSLPTDTFRVATNIRNFGWFARKGTQLYAWNTSTFIWEVAGGNTDTTSLSNRINSKLNISDTTGKWISHLITGYGIMGGPITTAGTLLLDSATVFPAIRTTVKPPLITITNQYGNTFDTILARSISDHGFATSMAAFGNSFTVGTGASPIDSAYITRLSVSQNLTLTNYAVSGMGVFRGILNMNANINPGHSIFSVWMNSFNDLRRTDTTNALTYRKTKNKIINAHKAAFACQYLKTYVEAGSGNVTRSGAGWSTAYSPSTVGGKSIVGAYTTIANDSLKRDFTGQTNVVVAMIGGDSVNQAYASGRAVLYEPSTGTVIKDTSFTLNSQWDGIGDGNNNNQRGPVVLIFYDLSVTKTYRIKLISTQSTNVFAVDYIGHLVDPATGMQLVIYDPAYMNATGYGTAPAGASNTVMDEGKRIIDSTINVVKRTYPVYLVNTNGTYNIATGLSGDNIHPNNTGHRQIYQAAIAVLPSVLPQPAEGSIFRIGSNLYSLLGGDIQQLNGYVNASTGITDSSTGTARYFKNDLVTGKAGGGTVTGGITTAENLTFLSTRTGDGKVFFGTTFPSTYVQSTGRWAINSTTGAASQFFMLGNTTLLGDHFFHAKQVTGSTGNFFLGTNTSDAVVFRVFSGGAIQGTGSGVAYPSTSSSFTLQISGGTFFIDGLTASAGAGIPIQSRSSTFTMMTGSGFNVNAFAALAAETVINDGSAAYDFRVESDGNANMIKVNGTTNRVGIGLTPTADVFEVAGNISLTTAGNKIKIATGTNASAGLSGAMTAGTITISTTAVTASSIIHLTPVGAGVGSISLGTVVAGTSFVINSSDVTDTRTVQWTIIN